MAQPNAALLSFDPNAGTQRQDQLTALLIKALGGTNTAISQPLADAATFAPGEVPLPPDAKVLQPLDRLRISQTLFNQFQRGEFEGANRALRGVGSGAAAEQQDVLDRIRNAFELANITERLPRVSQGGGGPRERFELPRPDAPPPPKVTARVPQLETPKPVKPAAPPKGISRLQKALDVRKQFEVEQRRRQAQLGALGEGGLRTAGAFSGGLARAIEPSTQDAFERRFRGARTADEAFFLELTRADPKALDQLDTQSLAKTMLRAWHEGSPEQVQEGFKILEDRTRRLGSGRSKRASTRRKLEARERRNYSRVAEQFDASSLFGVDAGRFGLSNEQVFRAFMKPADVADLLSELGRGRDPSDIANQVKGTIQARQFQRAQQEALNAQAREAFGGQAA